MSDAGTTRRAAVALVLSLAVHASSVAAFLVMPVRGGLDAPASVAQARGEPLRPVQITFVPMPPRRRAEAPAEEPPSPQRPPATRALALPRAREVWHPAPGLSPRPNMPTRADLLPASSTDPRLARVPEARPPDLAAAALVAPQPESREDAWSDPLPPPERHEVTGAAAARLRCDPPARAGVRTGAEVLDLPAPEYPDESRRLGEEGLVLLEVEVLADGRAGRIRVLRASAYPRLDEAAVAAVRKARFRPAMAGGAAVRSLVEVPVRFRLD